MIEGIVIGVLTTVVAAFILFLASNLFEWFSVSTNTDHITSNANNILVTVQNKWPKPLQIVNVCVTNEAGNNLFCTNSGQSTLIHHGTTLPQTLGFNEQFTLQLSLGLVMPFEPFNKSSTRILITAISSRGKAEKSKLITYDR